MAGLLDALRNMAQPREEEGESDEEARKRRERELKEREQAQRQRGRGSEYHRDNRGMENDPALLRTMKKLVRPRSE